MSKTLTFVSSIVIMGLVTGCASQTTCCSSSPRHFLNRETVTKTTHDTYPKKTPQTISLYTNDNKPNAAYRVIGIANVSKTNIFGMQRDQSTLDAMMKQLAANLGGDGLIEINQTDQSIQAKVIAYQKILL